MSDAANDYREWMRLVDELRALTIKIHGGEVFVKRPDADLIRKLEDAGRALKKARKNGA